MKRKLLLTAAAALSVALMGAAVACGNPVHSSDENSSGNPPASSAEALTLEEFKIPESAFVELGETYTWFARQRKRQRGKLVCGRCQSDQCGGRGNVFDAERIYARSARRLYGYLYSHVRQ